MSTVENKKRVYTSEVLSEDSEFTWEIKNFRTIIAMKKDFTDLKLIFEAGDSIGFPTQWKLSLGKLGDKVIVSLRLLQTPSDDKAFATFGVATGQLPYVFKAPEDYKLNDWTFIGFPTVIDSLERFSDSCLTEGTFVLHVKFTLFNNITNDSDSPASKRSKSDPPLKSLTALTQNFETLLDSEEMTDVTLEMPDGRTLKAHAVILAARSPVFSAMFQSPMDESSSRRVVIEDLSCEVMSTVLKFIYTGKLAEKFEEYIEEIVYAADKYAILSLLTLCDETLATTCKPGNAWTLFELAQLHGLKIAEGEIDSYIETNIGEILNAKKAAHAN